MPAPLPFLVALCALTLFGVMPARAFYLPGTYMRTYATGEEVWAKVNSLTSFETEMPFSYYSLPYCVPRDPIRDSAENLGEVLMGDRIHSSPYRFRVNKNESIFICLTNRLTPAEVELFSARIREMYQVNMILDNLPVLRVTDHGDITASRWTGFPVGFVPEGSTDVYIVNHLKFRVLVHEVRSAEYQIVGFEVVACSVKRHPVLISRWHMYDKIKPASCRRTLDESQVVQEELEIAFTYEVEWIPSSIEWHSRWDTYLNAEPGGAKVHWFSITNSLLVVLFLAAVVFIIFLRTVRRDLTRYEELNAADDESREQLNEELSGWKLVVGDVFREPPHLKLLCVVVSDGVQIIGMAVATILFAALGFMSPASRGALLTAMLLLYLILGVTAGYAAVWLWRAVKGTTEGWQSVCWSTACFFPGFTFVILTVLNAILWGRKSTGALPFWLFFLLLAMWFFISVPLTLLGGLAATHRPDVEFPVRPNPIPREIPPRKFPSWLLVLGAGTLPFATLFIELFFILSSIWLGRIYYVFGFLLIVLILLIIVCAEVSLVLTYMHLCAEDWQWWWKAFLASGTVGIYVFLYSISYLVFDLKSLSGPASTMLYLGYSLIMAVAILLSAGTIGFSVSLLFVHYLFSSVKID